jgi:hypothetical protein
VSDVGSAVLAGDAAQSSLDVRLAETTRSIPTAAEAAPHHAPGTESQSADVDALARKVYDILKRRLAAERRRGA